MSFQVVCISRTLAAGGESIGEMVAQRLGMRYVDEEIIQRAARQAQVDPALVAATEHRQPLMRRLLDQLATGAGLAGTVTLATGLPIDAFVGDVTQHAAADDLRIMIRAAIYEIARAGNAVIVAHAASMALAGTAGVLRVLVTGSAETRAHRLAEAERITPAAAADRIAESDRARVQYFQRFYKISEELPTHYDVVINSDVLTPAEASAVIVAAARTA